MIGFEKDGKVGRLFLQRATYANAFTSAMLRRIAEILETASGESDVIVIHAVGDDFSLGRDREEPKNPDGPYAAFSEISRVNAAFEAFPGVVVTAIKGRAFGFGLGLAMRSDIAISADNARFMLDEVSLGFPPMFLMEVIHEYLTPKRALDLILSSREFDAAEALDIGLLSRVVPAGLGWTAGHRQHGRARRDRQARLRIGGLDRGARRLRGGWGRRRSGDDGRRGDPRQRPRHRFAPGIALAEGGGRAPPALPAVEEMRADRRRHHQAAVPELAGDAEGQPAVVHVTVVHDAVMAEMSPGGGDRASAERIVDDLAAGPGEHVDRIGPRFAGHRDA